jgi:hypothetical protein
MAQNSTIEQQPLYNQMPVGQDVIFVVSNQDAVANQTKVKFCVEVHISDTLPPDPNVSANLVATFKAAPNNAGVGIFDFRNVVENYVSADNMATNGSSYKGATTSDNTRHPLHLVDKYSLNNNLVRYMALKFYVEFLGADDGVNPVDANNVRAQVGTEVLSDAFTLYNAYLKYTDKLVLSGVDFGYSLVDFFPADVNKRFITNAPVTQYANVDDYGTLSFLAPTSVVADNVARIKFTYYDTAGGTSTDNVVKDVNTGGYLVWNAEVNKQLVHFGCFPANLRNWSSNFQALVTAGTIQGGYYTVQALDSSLDPMTKEYTINVNCPNGIGYESIRLCWMNQWGAWDYYTFTKKSTKSISTQGSTYNQLGGTWNESVYRIDSFKGGKKSFRRNATERISMNTDYLTESENVMFEELINSPEVYQLDGFQADTFSALNQYVTPVRITTSSFTKKTIANDKLIQYSFDIEKSKTLRTQTV